MLRDPAPLARVRTLIASAPDSAVLAGLVHLAGHLANADSAQLSLLADVQHATVIQCCEPTPWQQTSDVDDSLCTVSVLSRDVLVAADTHRHPWLHDLPPVLSGAVGAYLGVPLRLTAAPPSVRCASTGRNPEPGPTVTSPSPAKLQRSWHWNCNASANPQAAHRRHLTGHGPANQHLLVRRLLPGSNPDANGHPSPKDQTPYF